MRIEIVQLENIRSHIESTVPFARGFNCLVGGLGCGKSSILYSIDFALFGEPLGRTYEYLLREGAESGKVTVQFSQNGKSYKITRGLKRHGKGISQDLFELKLFENDVLLSSLKSDAVAEQIKALTGLDKELFREIVWMKQEHLKELLDIQPRERQKRLDKLFGLSDYEEAYTLLGGYEREYEGARKTYETDPDVTGLEKIANEYNSTTEEYALVEVELQDLAGKHATAKRELETLDSKLRKLEEVRTQHEELKRKEAQTLANLKNLESAASALLRKIEAKKIVIANLEQSLNSMSNQAVAAKAELGSAGFLADQPIEALRQHLASFDDKIAALRGELEAAQRGIQADSKRIESISTENRCPLCLQTITEDYKNSMISRIQEENRQRQQTIAQLKQKIDELQKLKNKANLAFSTLQMIAPKIEDAKIRLMQESADFAELQQELDENRRKEEELRVQLDSVRFEISRFDLSELEATKTQLDHAFRRYYAVEAELRTKENRKKDLFRRMDELKQRIDQAQQKIEQKAKIEKLIEAINSIRDAYRNIQPKLRREFVKVLRNFVQQVLDDLTGGEGPTLNVLVDETYTLFVKSEAGTERDVMNLSGGERTLLAFAYRLGLGQLIMQSRTGHGLSMLLLDEPTESLGREDGSIDRLAEAISRFKAIEQIIAVTHSEAFAEKAEHVIRLEKEAGASKVFVER
ncbi:MAG: SMC family ATPase [Candidatus Bathyarchaeia archaeon]